MPWITIEELSRGKLSRATWEKRLRQGEAESYVDERGRRWIWREPNQPALDLRRLGGTLARIEADVRGLEGRQPAQPSAAELRAELAQLSARLDALEAAPSSQPEPEPESVEREPAPTLSFPRVDRAARLLDLVASYGGSEREIEREAGLPKAFLAKAKKGERRGPRSAGSWDRLEAFFEAQGGRAARAA